MQPQRLRQTKRPQTEMVVEPGARIGRGPGRRMRDPEAEIRQVIRAVGGRIDRVLVDRRSPVDRKAARDESEKHRHVRPVRQAHQRMGLTTTLRVAAGCPSSMIRMGTALDPRHETVFARQNESRRQRPPGRRAWRRRRRTHRSGDRPTAPARRRPRECQMNGRSSARRPTCRSCTEASATIRLPASSRSRSSSSSAETVPFVIFEAVPLVILLPP